MWYQQGHDILFQYWSGPQKFVFYFAKKLKKNQGESNNLQWTCDQWGPLTNQHQRMHGVQEETELSRKGHGRECIGECAEKDCEQIVENAQNSNIVSRLWSRQILAHLMNSIGDVWTSNCEINQAANQSFVKRRIRQWFPPTPPRGCQMRLKFNWSVNNLAVSESSSRQKVRSILGLSNIKTICAQ